MQDDTSPSPVQPETSATQMKTKKRPGRKLLLLGSLLAVFLVGGAAAAYVSVFNKSPEDKFYSALENTGSALESFLYAEPRGETMNVNGSLNISSPLAVDGSIEGAYANGNGMFTADIGGFGVRVNAEVRSQAVEGSDAPDLYVKVDGLEGVKGLLGTFAGESIAQQASPVINLINDRWVAVDHTIFEQAVAEGDDVPMLTEEEIEEIKNRAVQPITERLLGSDDKAVFTVVEELGSEEFEGDNTEKLRVGVNKDNFIAFLNEYESVVNETKLKELLEAAYPRSADEPIPFDKIDEAFADVDFQNAKADVWVAGDKFIRNVRIYTDQENTSTNYLDIMIPYEGGDDIPVMLKATIDDGGATGELTSGVTFNTQTGDISFSFDVDMSGSVAVKSSGELSFTSSDEVVDVSAPDDATNVYEIIGLVQQQLQQSLQSQLPDEFQQQLQLDDIELSL